LRRFIAEKLGGEPPFFLHLARDALQRKPPALFEGGMLRDLWRTGTPMLGLKDAMIPFVSFARLYALRHGVEATNTLARLESLRDLGVLKPPFYRECARAYTFLAEARLRRQVASVRGRASSEDVLDSDRLGRADDAMLRRAAEQAALLQKRTSFDFLGSAL
jgi:CBS domain-containing protein